MKIGITGYAKSGKDVLADILVEDFGFLKVNMSDPLDHYLQILNPIIVFDAYSNEPKYYERYADLRARISYVDAKKITEVRELLQRFGTDVGRDIDPDIWTKVRNRNMADLDKVVCTGVRYVNEAEGFDAIWKVSRAGYGPLNDHPSEQLEPVFALATAEFHNNSTLEYFEDLCRASVRHLFDT